MFGFRSFFFLFISGLFLSCCSNSKGKLDAIKGPDWIFDAYSVNTSTDGSKEIAAVGIGEKTAAGIKVQIAQAEVDARANIANQINSEIARVTRDFMKTKNINTKEEFEKEFIQVTEEIIRDLNLANVVRTHIWQDVKTEAVYVRMATNSKMINELVKNSIEIYNEKVKDKDFKYVASQLRDEIKSSALPLKKSSSEEASTK
jgi:hypothetical protein